MRHEDSARMLISYFNMQSGTRYRASDWGEQMDALLDDDASNVNEIRLLIKQWPDLNKLGIREFLDYAKNQLSKPAQQAEPTQVQAQVMPAAQPAQQVTDSLNILSSVVADMVARLKTEEIQAKVTTDLQSKIDQYIINTYGPIERKVTLVSELPKIETQGIQHSQFETVLKFVVNDEPVYLTGPAGSGKNVICKEVAKALGLDFYFTNAVTQEYKLTGFTDANGTFHESQFYKAFTKGGVFMLDEMDASIPEVLIILNAAIANRYFDFPAPIGKVEAHPNFRVIAAGNTLGYGADSAYVGRNTLDAASLDRFAIVEIDYDERIEMSVAGGNTQLVKFCRAFRDMARKNGLTITVSYRAIGRLAKMESLLDTVPLLKTCLVKGMEKDDLNMLMEGLHGFGKYSDAMEQIIRAA